MLLYPILMGKNLLAGWGGGGGGDAAPSPSIPQCYNICGLSSGPDPIENLEIESTSPSSINVVFNPPERPNGLITSYLITYNGQRDVS